MSENLSTQILFNDDRILSDYSATLYGAMRRRASAKEVIVKRIKESGLKVPEICRRAKARNHPISVTAVKWILNGSTKNPGVYTIEAIAIGLDITPLVLMAEILGDRSEDPNLRVGNFAVLVDIYKELTGSQKTKADAFVDGLLLQLKHIKSQTK